MCFNSIAIIQNEGLLYRARLSSNAADLEKSLGKRFLVFIFCENLLFLSTCRGYNVGRFDGKTPEDRVDFWALATPKVSSDAADVASVGPTRSDLVFELESSSSLVFPRIPPSPSRSEGMTRQVPQQKNEYDCGLFVLYFMKKFIEDTPERFRRKYLSMFGSKWFKSEEASGLRKQIQGLVLEVFGSAMTENDKAESACCHESPEDVCLQ
ncbi:hypothetical protein ZIOFF_038428 [Zingiber officinale]|uniref:Ubiquitin-like protease family profile domain-containing protein n=1 Tax=Zingiber officinale TaxID=94328 RepID=A0A8J5G336_ZINOF|nr:hypothetical protein ZIOFF_038428 [Zingiber officinale]